MKIGPNPWTDERLELVAAMWNEGSSATEIARKIGGCSRNAVIGVIHRRGLSKRSPAFKPDCSNTGPRRPAAPRRPRTSDTGRAVAVTKLRPLKPLPPAPPVINYINAKPWTERKFGECAYPIGEGADLLSCCAPTERTYCRGCETVMYQADKPSLSKTMRIARLAA